MSGLDESQSGAPAQAATRSARHGGSEGLSAAELIARSRAASPVTPQRPSRSGRRRASDNDSEQPSSEAVPPGQSDVAQQPSQLRHLSVVHPVIQLSAPVVVDDPAASDLPEIAVPRRPRAGRNLPAAIGVGVGLGAVIIASLAIYRPSFVVLVGIAVAIGVYEMVTALATVEARPPLVPLLAGVLAMEAAAWSRGPDGLVGALLLTVLGLTIWRLAEGAAGYLRDVAAANLVAIYIPFLAGFAVLMTHAEDGAARIVLFILTVVCSDTGGYAVGVLFGKHPMAPTVSPKKSWEGFAGSLLAGGAEGVLMMLFCFHHAWWKGALFGIAIVITATLGDLGESMIKRDLGLKDMGNLLPGHGGLMDRLDSLLPCAPVTYLLLAAFLPG